jgi:pyrroline-5-carboxylate reductase
VTDGPVARTAPRTLADHQGTIVLVGAGQMGGALLDAWLDGGMPSQRLSVIDPNPRPDLLKTSEQTGVTLNRPSDHAAAADILVLAIKPQMLESAVAGLAGHVGPQTLLISVLAGKTIADLRAAFPQAAAIARAMPNTPASVRRGITGVAVDAQATPAHRAAIQALMDVVGRVEWLADERLIDAVTAVSGSGPAYVFYFVECLAQAGEAAGLAPDLAMRLARATVEGAGALMTARSDLEPDALRRAVTSPGGTTAEALRHLMGDEALAGLITTAVLAAQRRAAELAGPAKVSSSP